MRYRGPYSAQGVGVEFVFWLVVAGLLAAAAIAAAVIVAAVAAVVGLAAAIRAFVRYRRAAPERAQRAATFRAARQAAFADPLSADNDMERRLALRESEFDERRCGLRHRNIMWLTARVAASGAHGGCLISERCSVRPSCQHVVARHSSVEHCASRASGHRPGASTSRAPSDRVVIVLTFVPQDDQEFDAGRNDDTLVGHLGDDPVAPSAFVR
jgi:hypothetical protein